MLPAVLPVAVAAMGRSLNVLTAVICSNGCVPAGGEIRFIPTRIRSLSSIDCGLSMNHVLQPNKLEC
jgi:hypothetical protein